MSKIPTTIRTSAFPMSIPSDISPSPWSEYTTIQLNATQNISVSCAFGSKFIVCSQDSQVPFFGCCNPDVDPCKQGCGQNNLQSAAYDPYYNNFTDQACVGGLFYKCAETRYKFVGCCTSDPCQEPLYCPTSNLREARRTTFNPASTDLAAGAASSPASPSELSPAGTNGSWQHNLASGAISGIAVGVVLVALGIGLVLGVFIRRRKHAKSCGSIGALQFDSLPPDGTTIEQTSPGFLSPVGSVLHGPRLSQPVISITPKSQTPSPSQPSALVGYSHNANDLPSSAELNTYAPLLSGYHSSQNTPIMELDSKHASLPVPELDSTPIADPRPRSNTPVVITVFEMEGQQSQVAGLGESVHVERRAEGPGWDEWNR